MKKRFGLKQASKVSHSRHLEIFFSSPPVISTQFYTITNRPGPPPSVHTYVHTGGWGLEELGPSVSKENIFRALVCYIQHEYVKPTLQVKPIDFNKSGFQQQTDATVIEDDDVKCNEILVRLDCEQSLIFLCKFTKAKHATRFPPGGTRTVNEGAIREEIIRDRLFSSRPKPPGGYS